MPPKTISKTYSIPIWGTLTPPPRHEWSGVPNARRVVNEAFLHPPPLRFIALAPQPKVRSFSFSPPMAADSRKIIWQVFRSGPNELFPPTDDDDCVDDNTVAFAAFFPGPGRLPIRLMTCHRTREMMLFLSFFSNGKWWIIVVVALVIPIQCFS